MINFTYFGTDGWNGTKNGIDPIDHRAWLRLVIIYLMSSFDHQSHSYIAKIR